MTRCNSFHGWGLFLAAQTHGCVKIYSIFSLFYGLIVTMLSNSSWNSYINEFS